MSPPSLDNLFNWIPFAASYFISIAKTLAVITASCQCGFKESDYPGPCSDFFEPVIHVYLFSVRVRVGASDDSVWVGGGLGLMMTVLWLGVGWG